VVFVSDYDGIRRTDPIYGCKPDFVEVGPDISEQYLPTLKLELGALDIASEPPLGKGNGLPG
jgi:hypothetical protein